MSTRSTTGMAKRAESALATRSGAARPSSTSACAKELVFAAERASVTSAGDSKPVCSTTSATSSETALTGKAGRSGPAPEAPFSSAAGVRS